MFLRRAIVRSSRSIDLSHAFRQPSHRYVQTLREKMEEVVPKRREYVNKIKKEYGDRSLGNVTVDMAYNGMRGIKGLIYETSLLDPEEGIRFRNYTIPECRKLLPKADNGKEPLPEGIFWLLLTGEIPTVEQVRALSADLASRAHNAPLPDNVVKALNAMPKDLHPMSQFSAGLLMLSGRSKFYKEYHSGNLHKDKFWVPFLEDVCDIIAIIPSLTSHIYRNLSGKKEVSNTSVTDWAGSYALKLGYSDQQFMELLRLYLCIHTDHEGGNVSAHATHLVGSSLSDAYLSYSAGLNGLAGPLHGLANQEVLAWLFQLIEKIGKSPSNQQIEDFLWETLKAGQVIPGYGHAVLRKTDPRYICQREFALEHFPNDPLIKLTAQLFELVPKVLTKMGKVKNPWPNVDAHSGVLLQHYGFKEQDFYTVLFGASRAIGALSGLIWDRILEFPLERPKSLTTEQIAKMMQKP